jgi:hypothetical protein
MRSDYALYAVAVIFFILTVVVAAYSMEQRLWIVTTAVLGLAFIGLGYSQRPRPTGPTTTAPTVFPPPPAPTVSPAQPAATEVVKEETTKAVVEVSPPTFGLTEQR